MKVLGLITEYNPFHYGHKYHLQVLVTGASHHCHYEWFFVQR